MIGEKIASATTSTTTTQQQATTTTSQKLSTTTTETTTTTQEISGQGTEIDELQEEAVNYFWAILTGIIIISVIGGIVFFYMKDGKKDL
jgi:guanyl-specific ribonuclease Sa